MQQRKRRIFRTFTNKADYMELSIIIIFRSSAVENVLRSADHEECWKIFLRIVRNV